MQPIRLTKVLAAASSTGIGTFSSAGVVSLNTAGGVVLDTGRRIAVWGTTSIETTILITGTNETGEVISELVFGASATGSITETTQDFKSVTAVSVSTAGVTSTAGYIGTSSHGGTPWKLIDNWRNPSFINFQLDPGSTTILGSFEYTFGALTYPWINPTSTSSGTNTWRSGAPYPVISSLGSSVSATTQANLNLGPHAVRITLTSSSSAAGTLAATVIQSG